MGLHTRHTSSQNPNYYIHTAFHIVRGNVHNIEQLLLNHIVFNCNYSRITHVGTETESECFNCSPDLMVDIVENFIQLNFPSSVTYETSLHGGMSRYVSHFVINNYLMRPTTPIRKDDYFTGNQEVYEIALGDNYFLDIATGLQVYRDDDDEVDEDEYEDYN